MLELQGCVYAEKTLSKNVFDSITVGDPIENVIEVDNAASFAKYISEYAFLIMLRKGLFIFCAFTVGWFDHIFYMNIKMMPWSYQISFFQVILSLQHLMMAWVIPNTMAFCRRTTRRRPRLSNEIVFSCVNHMSIFHGL